MADDERSRAATAGAPLLAIEGLSKRFTATIALDRVDFELRRGEIHALLGQNGAGKSTLIKILAGVYAADAGIVRLDGAEVSLGSGSLPIAFIHQDLGLVESMTVAENVAIARGYPRSAFGLISWGEVRRAAAKTLASVGSGLDPDAMVSTLPAAERSLVAICRALAIKADILILDEPTAALPGADVERLFTALEELRKNGIGIIYVTHRLDEVFRIADRITVLRDGKRVASSLTASTSSDQLIENIVGRSMRDAFVRPAPPTERIVLDVEGLVSGDVGPVSLRVAAGETLGLVGLRGAGHHTVGRAIFGQLPLNRGRITLGGQSAAAGSPAEAMRRRFGFVSSRRAEESIAANMSVKENIYLNPAATGRGVLQFSTRSVEDRAAARAIDRFAIKAENAHQTVATLSGGNQQKVVVARWMESSVAVLILEEPTIGVDVGSKAEIYSLLKASLAAGMAVLLISSDFEEVERICHRALVFSRGSVATELGGDSLTIANLTTSAAGGTLAPQKDVA